MNQFFSVKLRGVASDSIVGFIVLDNVRDAGPVKGSSRRSGSLSEL